MDAQHPLKIEDESQTPPCSFGSEDVKYIPSQTPASTEPDDNVVPVAVMSRQSLGSDQTVDTVSRKRSASPANSGRSVVEHRMGWVPPHDPDDEPLPTLPTFHPAAQSAERLSVGASERIQQLILNGPYKQDEQLPKLRAKVQRQARPRYELAGKCIMVDGEAGKGKSFTINNLLGHQDLSTQTGGPKGCTNVPIKYHKPTNTQNSPFQAKVTLSSVTHAVELVDKYILDVMKYSSYLDKMESMSNSDTEEDQDEEQELQQRCDSALSALSALFCNWPEFSHRDAAEDYLKGVASLEDPKVKKCHQRIKRIVNQINGSDMGSGTVEFEAADVAVLKNKIQPFLTSDTHSTLPGSALKCCPWPMVQLISIGVTSSVLKTGVVIADNPGLGDTNTSHVDRARQSLQEADIIMVIGDIERVDANPTVERELKWAYKRRGAKGVIMVCTKTDANLVNDIGTKLTPQETQRMSAIDNEITDINQQLWASGQSKQKAVAENDMTRLYELGQEEDRYRAKMKALERERAEIRVLARNRTAISLLREKYKRWTKGAVPDLPVFCVSNTEYDKYLSGYHESDPPQLSLEATGIPALRQYIYCLPSKARFTTLECHLKQNAQALLNSLEMFCTISRSQRNLQVTANCTVSRTSAKANVSKRYKISSDTRMESMKRELAKAESTWIARSGDKCDKWAAMNPRSYNSMMKKFGVHHTKTLGDLNINKDLLDLISKSIDSIFHELRDEWSTELTTGIAQEASRIIQKLIGTLEGDPTADVAGADTAFLENLEFRKQEVESACRELGEDLSMRFRTIQDNAVTLGEKSYFPPLMKKVYEETKLAKKCGRMTLHKSRCGTFKDGLQAKNGPFHSYQQKISRECRKALDEHSVEMVQRIDSIFAEIEDDADKACPSHEDNSPEGQEFRRKLRELVAETKKLYKDKILPDFEEARQSAPAPATT